METIGIIVAIIASVYGIFQSNRAIEISRQSQEVLLNISGNSIADSKISLMSLDSNSRVNECTSGLLFFEYTVKIDNISERKISIRGIEGNPLFEGYEFGIFTSNGRTGFQGQWSIIEASGVTPVLLPISIDAGESIDLTSKIGWPIEITVYKAIEKVLLSNKDVSLLDAYIIAAANGRSLGCSVVEYESSDEVSWMIYETEKHKIILEIDIETSFGTHHKTTTNIF